MSFRRNSDRCWSVAGLCTSKTYADGSTVYYTHTPDGLPLRTTYSSGRWITNHYDARRQLVGTTSSDGAQNTAYVRDAFGRVVKVERGKHADSALQPVLDNFYDAENRIRGIAAADAAGRSFSVAYTNDAGYNYGYAITTPNGGVIRRVVERDPFRRGLVTNCSTYHGDTLVDAYAYTYDAGGRPVSRNADAFGYDARDQVTFAAIGTNVYTHAYDGIGNHVLSGVNSVTNLMENNQLNQLKRIVSSDGSTTNAVSWNVHGGMARDDRWTYTYDAEDQLIAVTSRQRTNGAIRVRSAYDCRHRRIAKIVERLAVTQAPPPALPVVLERWDLVERRDFVWDDWNIIHEFATAVDGVSTNVTEIQYFWGLDLSDSLQGAGGVGGLLAVSRNGSFYFPVYDNNGNVMKYVDESGAVTAAYVYDDFGKIVSQTGSLADAFSFRFSTKYFDQEVDLCAYQRRFYDPDDRFWINRDPIGESGNRGVYTFCLNNSLNYFDVLGNEAFTSIILKFKLQKTLVAIKEVLTQTDSGQDPYGHWWIEFDGESYGWWPSNTVSTTDTFLGVPGKLNGLQADHDNKIASPTRDAHHGEVPEAMSHPFRKTDGVMKYGKAAKSKCKCVTEDDAKNCVRAFARQYKGKWSWPWGQNCHSFLNEALDSCCMRR